MDRELQRNLLLFTGAMILTTLVLSILAGKEGMFALIACAIFNHTFNQLIHK